MPGTKESNMSNKQGIFLTLIALGFIVLALFLWDDLKANPSIELAGLVITLVLVGSVLAVVACYATPANKK